MSKKILMWFYGTEYKKHSLLSCIGLIVLALLLVISLFFLGILISIFY